MLLYLIGFGTALVSALVLNKILQFKSKSYFVVEMPNYKLPMLKNVVINVLEKTKAFVFGAGKMILAISIILWFLASYGPGKDFKNAQNEVLYANEVKMSKNEFLEFLCWRQHRGQLKRKKSWDASPSFCCG